MFDSNPSSSSHPRSDLAAVSAMAEAQPTSGVATGVQPGHGSVPNPWQGDIDALKQEVNDLRTTVLSLTKEIEELKRVKVQTAALRVPPVEIEVKSEPTEAALAAGWEEAPAPTEPRDALDLERMEVDDGPADASHDTGDASELQVASVPSRRQSTEEPVWTTPPRGEVLFRINPEYAQRIARANEVPETPEQVPTPPPQPCEETLPPTPLRSPSPAPVARPTEPISIILASQGKRKHNFELIIEVPAKRFKASNYSTPSSSNGSVASSSRTTFNTPSAPAKPLRRSSKAFVVDLDRKIRDVVVTREYLNSYFGASQRFTVHESTKEQLDKHGYDHFVFIHGDTTPQIPSAPGEPGLTALFEEKQWPAYDRYRIFARVRVSPARWQYMGSYKATKLPAWTSAEVKRQRHTVKWHLSMIVRASIWARPMVARIMLREELGREPTKKEVNDRVHQIKDKAEEPAPVDTIIAALEKGEEKVYPWRLECVDYEENLQWEIAATFPHHEGKGPRKSNSSANA